MQRVQALLPGDYRPRLEFCHWLRNIPTIRNQNFAFNILFTDEAQFTRDGINNFHNQHIWETENPHPIVEGGHQQRFSCNVWAGIFGDMLLGPVFLPSRLNGASHTEFLTNTLPELLEDVPIAVRQQMWFQHDGAPAHFSRAARAVLNSPNYFQNRWRLDVLVLYHGHHALQTLLHLISFYGATAKLLCMLQNRILWRS